MDTKYENIVKIVIAQNSINSTNDFFFKIYCQIVGNYSASRQISIVLAILPLYQNQFRLQQHSLIISLAFKLVKQYDSILLVEMFQEILLAIVIISVIIGYKYYYAPRKQIRQLKKVLIDLGYSVYEQPFSFLGIGFMTDIQRCMQEHKDALYTQKTAYTKVDIAIGNALDKVVLVIIKPELMKEFLSAESVFKYEKVDLLIRGLKDILGEGILFSEGDGWKNKRKIISKVFNFELLMENIPKIVNICDKWLEKFDEDYRIGQNRIQFDPLNLSVKIFNGVMMKCFFGSDQIKQKVRGESFQQFAINIVNGAGGLSKDPIALILGKHAYKFGLSSMIRKVKADAAIFKKIVAQIIQKRSEQILTAQKPQRITDILQALIYQRMSNQEQFSYSNQELIDEFSTFLVAGTDTTSRFFTMMVYYIAKYPQIQKRLRKQIEEVISDAKDITYEHLKKLTYIDWVQHETTRHYGPGNGQFLRVAIEDYYFKDIPILKGILAAIQPMASHYNTDYFKDPFEFRPERWDSECDNLPPYAFTGFSGGPRGCIGKQLAHLESKISLVRLIMRYKWLSLAKDNVTMKYELIYEPSPFKIIFEK